MINNTPSIQICSANGEINHEYEFSLSEINTALEHIRAIHKMDDMNNLTKMEDLLADYRNALEDYIEQLEFRINLLRGE